MVRKSGDSEEALFPSSSRPDRVAAGRPGRSTAGEPGSAEPGNSAAAGLGSAVSPCRADPADSQAESVLRTYLRAAALKNLYRQGWLKRGVPEARCESVADHSFGSAILALLLAGKPPFEDVDPDRCLRMALVHELGEVYAGDITPVDGVSAEEKHRLERASLERVLADLPERDGLIELWEDFEDGSSPEARLLARIDRLEMGIQAAVYRAEGFPRMEEFILSAEKAVDGGLPAALLALADSAAKPTP